MKPWEKYQTKPWEQYDVPQETSEKGFLDNVGEDLSKRAEYAGKTFQRFSEDDIGPSRALLRLLGSGAGAVGDVGGNVITSGLKTADELTGGYVGDAISGALDRGMSIPIGSDRTLGDLVTGASQGVGGAVETISEEYPEITQDVESLMNIGLLGVPAAGYAKKASQVSKIGKRLKRVSTPKQLPTGTSQQIREKAGALFKQAEEQGGNLKPQFMDNYLNDINKLAEKDPLVTAIVKKGGGSDAYSDVGDIFSQFKGQPMTFDRASSLDETLGKLAYKNADAFGKLDDTGRQFLDMQTKLRNMIEKADDKMFEGGRQGFETAKEARKHWAAQLRMRDVEKVIERANPDFTQNPTTVLKTGFKNILTSGDRIKGYTPKEVKAMKRAAKTGSISGLLNVFGSGLAPIGAGTAGLATGGPAGALAAIPAYVAQQASKGGANAIQMKKAKDVLSEIAKRVETPKPRKMDLKGKLSKTGDIGKMLAPISLNDSFENGVDEITLREIMKLPPEQAKILLERLR